MTGRKRVLVISDRYPPNTDGGAELSLHDTLCEMPATEFDIRILALTPEPAIATDETVAGLPVRRVGYDPFWPQNLSRARAAGAGASGLLRAGLREVGERPDSFARLASYGLWRAGRSEMPHPGSDADTIAASGQARAALEDLVTGWKPDLIHADNKTSILLAASIDRGSRPLAAMIRDHRFFCGHASQSMTVGERACTACAFECTKDASFPGRPLLRSAMAAEVAYRRTALRSADRVATTSQYLADVLQRSGIGMPITVIGNPHPKTDAAAGSAPPGQPPVVLFVGNLRREKGAMVLVEAFARLRDIPDLRIVFAGRGPLEPEVRQSAAALGMGDRVELSGFLTRAELFAALARASVVVAPTLWPEPFGRLPLESGIARRPIVASSLGGHLETVIDGKTGILVPPADRDALAGAIRDLVEHPEKAARIGREAERHIRANFDPGVIGERLAAFWHDLVSGERHDDTRHPATEGRT